MSVTARELHQGAFVFDAHNDSAGRVLAGEDLSASLPGGHMDLPRMRRGGLGGGIFAIWIDPETPDALRETLARVGRLRSFLEAAPEFRLVLRSADVGQAGADREIAALIGVEGGYGVRSAADVNHLFEAGVRCLTLTWMTPTGWADASGMRPVHGGLSREGRRIVERCQALGILVDISHASDTSARAVLACVGGPVIASHSGARAVADHHRNLPDDLLEELAKGDGVVGVNFFSGYLDEGFARGFERLCDRLGLGPPADPPDEGAADDEGGSRDFDPDEELARLIGEELQPVPLSRLTEHFRHAIGVAGPAHVGLGSDFDGVLALPEGLRDVADLPRVTEALLADGLGEPAVRDVLGRNFRRVIDAVLP